jgi:hypothetical protein
VDFYGTELSLQVNSLSQTFHDEKFMREQESISELFVFVKTTSD